MMFFLGVILSIILAFAVMKLGMKKEDYQFGLCVLWITVLVMVIYSILNGGVI